MRMQQLAVSERPREKLLRDGPESLSTVEVLAVILGTGTRTKPVLDLAGEVLALDLAVPGCDYLCLLDRYVLIHYTNWTGAGTETGICWFDKDDIAKGGLQIRELTCD